MFLHLEIGGHLSTFVPSSIKRIFRPVWGGCVRYFERVFFLPFSLLTEKDANDLKAIRRKMQGRGHDAGLRS